MAVALKTQSIAGEQVIYVGPAALMASKSHPGDWWIVEGARCSCPGFEYRGRCRHIAAAAQAAEDDRPTAEPVALSEPEPEGEPEEAPAWMLKLERQRARERGRALCA